MANRRALVAGTTSVFAEINGSGDTLEVTNGGIISSSGALLLAGFNNVVEVAATDTLDVDAIDSSGAMTIGATSATGITIGKVGITTTIAGDLDVDGAETITGTSTFVSDATFQGDVTLGNDAGDTVDFGGGGGVTATGNPAWNFGTGQVDFGGNVDANSGLDVTGTLTIDTIPIIKSGDALVLGGTGTTEAPAVNSLTTAERTGLTGVNGMIVYDSSIGSLYAYTGGSWSQVAQGGSSPWQESGGVVSTTNTSWDIVAGAAATLGSEKLRVVGDSSMQGNLTFETGSDRNIQMPQMVDTLFGNSLYLQPAQGADQWATNNSYPGNLYLTGGDGGAFTTLEPYAAGSVEIAGGEGASTSSSGDPGGTGGAVGIAGGRGGDQSSDANGGAGGDVLITGGQGRTPTGSGSAGPGGDVVISGGPSTGGVDGIIVLGSGQTRYTEVRKALQGTDANGSVVIGHAGTQSGEGSTLQLASLTTTEKGWILSGTPLAGMLVWDETLTAFQWYDGSSWNTVASGAVAGGWTDDGSVVRLTTASDTVAIGSASMVGSEKLHVLGDTLTDGNIEIDYNASTRYIRSANTPSETPGGWIVVKAGDGSTSTSASRDGGKLITQGGTGGASSGADGGGGGDCELWGGTGGGTTEATSPGGPGGDTTVSAGSGGDATGSGAGGAGGGCSIQGGQGKDPTGTGDQGNGGPVQVYGGAGLVGGAVNLFGGQGNAAGDAGDVLVQGGVANGTGTSGSATLTGGTGSATGTAGPAIVIGGAGSATNGAGATASLLGGQGFGTGNGGATYVRGGTANGTGTHGAILIGDVSTSGVWIGDGTLDIQMVLGTGELQFSAYAGESVIRKDQAATETAGGGVAMYAGLGGDASTATAGDGGPLSLWGGNGGAGTATQSPGDGGDAKVQGGTGGTDNGNGGGAGGTATLSGGTATGNGLAGPAVVIGGAGSAADNGAGATASLLGGQGFGTGNGGATYVRGGTANGTGTDGAILVGDLNTSAVWVGAAAIPTIVGGVLRGPDDGTGIVLGHAPTSNTTGSAPQIVSVTDNTERDYLVEAAGMMVWNAGSTSMQYYDGSAWQDFAAGGATGWTDDGTVVRLTTASDTVAIGVATMVGSEKLRVLGDTYLTGDINFNGSNTRYVTVDPPTAADTAGSELWLEAGDASAGSQTGGRIYTHGGTGAENSVGDGAVGGEWQGYAGAGGQSTSSGDSGGAGGATYLTGGFGGNSTTGAGAGGAGGLAQVAGGNGRNPTSGGTRGDGGNAVLVGGSGLNGGDALVNGGNAFGGTDGAVNIGSTNTSVINLANATDNPAITQAGSGQVTFSGNVDADSGLDVSGGNLTYTGTAGSWSIQLADSALTQTGDGQVTFTGNVDASGGLDVSGGAQSFTGTAGSWTIAQADSAMTQTGAGAVTLTGDVSLTTAGQKLSLSDGGHIALDDRASDPATGASEGALYTKNDGSHVELYFREESSGTVHKITPAASQNAVYEGTAGETLAVGDLVCVDWDSGNTEVRVYTTDATDTGQLSNAVGICSQAAASAGDPTTIQLIGESEIIPNANWIGTAPTTADAGKPVYMSATAGCVTLDLPSGNVTVQQVGTLSDGASAARKIIINVMVQLKKAV